MVVYAFYESDTRVMQYSKALIAQGAAVDVLSIGRPGAPKREIIDGVYVRRLQNRIVNERGKFVYLARVLRFLFLASLVLTKRQITKRYDVVHVHSVPDFLVLAAIVPKLLGARVILDIHDILPEFYASKFGLGSSSLTFRLLVWTERMSARFADRVIIANHLWQEKLTARSVAPEKCTAIINYPDPVMFRRRGETSRNPERFVIMYPGSLNYHQGLDIAVHAFALVADRMPGAELHIYGEGPTKDVLLELVRKLGTASRVRFFDFLPTEEIAEKMSTADLAVVPKRASSGFGNEAVSTKIMEFMSLGVPVIVSRTKIDSFYHNESRVRFFKSEDIGDLAQAMLQLFRDPHLRRDLAENASRYVANHNWNERKWDYLRLVDTAWCQQETQRRLAAQQC